MCEIKVIQVWVATQTRVAKRQTMFHTEAIKPGLYTFNVISIGLSASVCSVL